MDIVISPALDPRNTEALGAGYADDPVVVATKRAMATAKDTAEAVRTADRAAASDPTLTEAARKLKVAQFASKRWEAATRALDAAEQGRRKAIAEERRGIEDTHRLSSDQRHLASEYRAALRAMPEAERTELLDRAIREGSATTIGAILEADPWLAGISNSQQELYRTRWAQAQAPERLARIAALEKLGGVHHRAGTAFMALLTDVESRAREAREAAERTRQAFVES